MVNDQDIWRFDYLLPVVGSRELVSPAKQDFIVS